MTKSKIVRSDQVIDRLATDKTMTFGEVRAELRKIDARADAAEAEAAELRALMAAPSDPDRVTVSRSRLREFLSKGFKIDGPLIDGVIADLQA